MVDPGGHPLWKKMTFILKYLLNEHTKFFDNAQQKKLLYDFFNLATFKISDLILCAPAVALNFKFSFQSVHQWHFFKYFIYFLSY